MLSRWKQKRKVKRALRDLNLQKALNRASAQHGQRFAATAENVSWEECRKKAREIRQKNVSRLPELIERFSEEAAKAGAQVWRVAKPEDALDRIAQIAREKNASLIVKSKSMVSEEIGLNDFLAGRGFRVVETDLGEWIIQLAGDRPSHITAPALHKTKEDVAALLSKELGRPVPADAKEIVRIAREEMRQYFAQADIGISGANFAVAESGTLVIVSNEGNARLVTALPPVHIAVVTTEKFVETLEEAVTLLKALTIASSGRRLTSYVTFITGPSSTTDIEKEFVVGVHGPQEVHIIILDNGRLALAESEDFHEILYCLKCGGCMLVCPVFQSIGGHVFGGPVYPGGIGTLLTAMTDSLEAAYKTLAFCADCKKCEDFCPVGIPTGDLLLKVKSTREPSAAEKGLSAIFLKKGLAEKFAAGLAQLQKIWQKDGYIRALPLPWAKGRRVPAVKFRKGQVGGMEKGQKIYFFQGCLVKYFFPEIREGVIATMSHLGYQVVVPEDQACCGAPSLHLGDEKAVRALAEQNLRSFEREKPDFIMTVCPTGHSLLKNGYSGVDARAERWRSRIVDFTAFVAARASDLTPGKRSDKPKLYYHYPCHYLHDPNLGDKPRQLLRFLGYELAAEENPPACCGFCGVFSLKNPQISSHLWRDKKNHIRKSGASVVATDCPGCLFQIRSGLKAEKMPVRPLHTAEIMAQLLEEDSARKQKNQ